MSTTKTKAPKLTLTEKRAFQWCKETMQGAYGEHASIQVEWIDSKMWGSNPRIMTGDGKATNIGGCGYDKLSACLASFLRFMAPIDSDAYHAIWGTGREGESATMRELAKAGWELKKTGSGKTWDAYTIAKQKLQHCEHGVETGHCTQCTF